MLILVALVASMSARSSEPSCEVTTMEDGSTSFSLSGSHDPEGGPASFDLLLDLDAASCTVSSVELTEADLYALEGDFEEYLSADRYDSLAGLLEDSGEDLLVNAENGSVAVLTILDDEAVILVPACDEITYTEDGYALLEWYGQVIAYDLWYGGYYTLSTRYSGVRFTTETGERVVLKTIDDQLSVMVETVDSIPLPGGWDLLAAEGDFLLDGEDGEMLLIDNDPLDTAQIIVKDTPITTGTTALRTSSAKNSTAPARFALDQFAEVTVETLDPPMAWGLAPGRLASTQVELTWQDASAKTVYYKNSDYRFVAGWNVLLTKWIIQSAKQGAVWYEASQSRVCTYAQGKYYNTNFPLSAGHRVDVFHQIDLCGTVGGRFDYTVTHIAMGPYTRNLLYKRVTVK